MDLSRFFTLDAVLVCGLPGSGKSHFSSSFFDRDGRKRINRKEIRRLLYEMTSFGKAWREDLFNDHDELLVHHVERKIYEHLLQAHSPVLVDSTNMTVESRQHYVTVARAMKRTIGCIFLNTPLKTCLERNRGRGDAISEAVITNLYAAREIPEKTEGYKELVVIENY
jgi:tRNA uridine 5-carbamoylmethylation protein Kti12